MPKRVSSKSIKPWSYQQTIDCLYKDSVKQQSEIDTNASGIETLNTDLADVNLHKSGKHTINVSDWTFDGNAYSFTMVKESNDGIYTIAPDPEATNVITNQIALANLQIAIKETSTEIILMTAVEPKSTVYIAVYFDASKLNLGGE